jgi:hypothetical protein
MINPDTLSRYEQAKYQSLEARANQGEELDEMNINDNLNNLSKPPSAIKSRTQKQFYQTQ